MAYTVTELVTNAWYLSNIVGRGFETVSGEQLKEGVQLLNALLSFKTATQRLIPYYEERTFTGVVGEGKYFVPGLILLENLTFDNDSVRWAMQPMSRNEYFGGFRANGISSLPGSYHVERTLNGSNIYMYFLPNETYTFTVWGKFALTDVTEGQNLLLTLDRYYIDYLRYALAESICQENNIEFRPQNKAKLREYEKKIFDISPLDFTTTKRSMFGSSGGLNWGDINIGRGYRP